MDVLEDWLLEMAGEDLVLPDEPAGGAMANLWAISFAPSDMPGLPAMTAFIERAVEVRRAAVQRLGGRPATFYAWHDAQAGQLRFSVARCTPQDLPFRATVIPTALSEILRSFIDDPSPGSIPWSALEAVAAGQAAAQEPEVPGTARVWSFALATADNEADRPSRR